jgi:REP element-mobilizing transposase RayT
MWERPSCRDLLLKNKPHSENLRLHRLADAPATFFVTKSLYPKKPVLDPKAREVIISALAFSVQKRRIYLRAFVVMPDHWHALFALTEPWTLPRFMHSVMSFIGGKTSALLKSHGTSWQDGYYDTRCKTVRQFAFVAHYIEQNPVAKGLVQKPEEWDASSARLTELITQPWPLLYD